MDTIRQILKKIVRAFFPPPNEIEELKKRGLTIGEHVDVYSEYAFDANYPGLITIGNNVTIAANVRILAHDASMGYLTGGSCKIGIVEIGNNVFIGNGSIVLPNTRIGDWSIIGAGSVVTGDVPAHSVFAGNPARFIMTVEDFQRKHITNIETHPAFDRPWREWPSMTPDEWKDAKNKLSDTFGYVVRKK